MKRTEATENSLSHTHTLTSLTLEDVLYSCLFVLFSYFSLLNEDGNKSQEMRFAKENKRETRG